MNWDEPEMVTHGSKLELFQQHEVNSSAIYKLNPLDSLAIFATQLFDSFEMLYVELLSDQLTLAVLFISPMSKDNSKLVTKFGINRIILR